jgi:hypothetical protein
MILLNILIDELFHNKNYPSKYHKEVETPKKLSGRSNSMNKFSMNHMIERLQHIKLNTGIFETKESYETFKNKNQSFSK